jgi:hypothetical protein
MVVLVVASLVKQREEGRTVREMRRTLQSVPQELDNLFTGYSKTVSANDRLKTMKLMQWILFARIPLTPMQLSCALAYSVEDPPKPQRCWQESDDYAENEPQIEKKFRTLSKDLVEIKDIYDSGYGKYYNYRHNN